MSYDLTLFRPAEGVEPSDAYEQIVSREEARITELQDWLKQPLSERVRVEMRRIANSIKIWRPALEEFIPNDPLPWIELTDLNLEVQLNVGEDTVRIEMPYFRPNVREMMGCTVRCIETVHESAGYVAYDPQLGQFVTAADLEAMIFQYQAVRALMISQTSPRDGLPTKPWWKFWGSTPAPYFCPYVALFPCFLK
jgi:hypothetical protein